MGAASRGSNLPGPEVRWDAMNRIPRRVAEMIVVLASAAVLLVAAIWLVDNF
jgi:hypothetical protein